MWSCRGVKEVTLRIHSCPNVSLEKEWHMMVNMSFLTLHSMSLNKMVIQIGSVTVVFHGYCNKGVSSVFWNVVSSTYLELYTYQNRLTLWVFPYNTFFLENVKILENKGKISIQTSLASKSMSECLCGVSCALPGNIMKDIRH